MLAKAMVQAMNFCGSHRPLREQAKRRPARSHRSASSSSTTRSLTGATRTARQSTRRVLRLIQVCRFRRVLVGASLLANTIDQTMNFCGLHWPLREQAKRRPARSHRSASSSSTTRSLTGATRTARQSARRVLRLIQVCRVRRVLVGASLLAKAIVQAMSFCRLHRPLREQAKRRPARSHRSASSSSTTRSLTGATRTARQSARRVLRLIQVCRVRRVLVGASLLAKAIVQAMSFCGLHWPLREQAPTGLRPVH
ncbi:hypothetical protein SAMN05444065_11287 [Pseudomonas syringae]|uniref:DUF1534 domain-containing protein n=1 Tax=Pseudomonas syringae TaxID=317 RepID=A0AB38BX15_PSESX|nr:hypothetical protein SAMN05444065_11287 [Pseudomonas syringae]SFO63372.1 hypothetical protein SAMN05444063_11287 [Pseudomonas syringae]